MKAEEWELEEIKIKNLKAFSRIERLYLAFKDLEAFEHAVLGGGKNCPALQTLRPPLRPVLRSSHAY
jgi:hypothetical protein